MNVSQSRGQLDDVIPDNRLGQEASAGQSVCLLSQQIVLGLGVGSGALAIEGVNERSELAGIVEMFGHQSLTAGVEIINKHHAVVPE